LNSPSAELLARRAEWVTGHCVRLMRTTNEVPLEFYFGQEEKLYQARLGHIAPIMNHGTQKELLFAVTRRFIEARAYDCFMFSSDVWRFDANEAFLRLSAAARHAVIDKGFRLAQSLGYGQAIEALAINAQTPERTHMVTVRYSRDPEKPENIVKIAEPESSPGKMLGGRSLMWGDWDEPGMAEAYAAAAGPLLHDFERIVAPRLRRITIDSDQH